MSCCGHNLRLFLKIEQGRVAALKCLDYGCPANRTAVEFLAGSFTGRQVEDWAALKAEDIAQGAQVSRYCAGVVRAALNKAIAESSLPAGA